MRSPGFNPHSYSSGGVTPDELTDLLEAAEELESQLGTAPGVVVRQLTDLLRRRTTFARLDAQFGVSLEAKLAMRA